MLGSWTKWGSRRRAANITRAQRRHIKWALLAAFLVVFSLSAIQRVDAAIELAYYRASSTDVSVLLEWATAREVNLDGFEILCKRVDEPDTAYHPIGSRIAQGGPETPASYSFNVTSGIVYGEAYCFRLREVTTDDTPGEEFDVCGYGPGVTPSDATPAADASLTVTPTTIVIENPDGDVVPTFTPTPVAGQSPLLTPSVTVTATQLVTASVAITPTATSTATVTATTTVTATATVTATTSPEQPESPLPTPQGADASAGVAGSPAEAVTATVTITPTAVVTPTPSPTATLTPTVAPTPTLTYTPTATEEPSPVAAAPAGDGAPPNTPEVDPATLEPPSQCAARDVHANLRGRDGDTDAIGRRGGGPADLYAVADGDPSPHL